MTELQLTNKIKALEARIAVLEQKANKKSKKSKPTLTAPKD